MKGINVLSASTESVAEITATSPTADRRPLEHPAARFLTTLFGPDDIALFRPVETWTADGKKQSRVDYKKTLYRAGEATLMAFTTDQMLRWSEAERLNVFFGVCPRFGDKGQFDLAWQIRKVPALWADIDHIEIEAAQTRIKDSGLPQPSIIVNSGNGAHCYWLLNQPYLIDDVDDPVPVLTEWVVKDGKKVPRKYFVDEHGDEIPLQKRHLHPALSPKAQLVQDVLGGIAKKIGGDHTTDLTRLLRLPGTMNRKDERNGKSSVPCTLVTCDPNLRYSFAQFESLAAVAPATEQRQVIASLPLPKVRKITPTRQDKFDELITQSQLAPKGARSEADFALCCFAIRYGVARDLVWQAVENVGKFAEGGERYFDRTWERAENAVRLKLYDRHASEESARTTTKEFDDCPEGQAPRLVVLGTDESRVVDEVLQALLGLPDLYQRGGQLVEIVYDAELPACVLRREPGPRIARIMPSRLRELITLAARIVRVVGDGEYKPCHPPEWLVREIDARNHLPGLPHLEAIVQTPVMLSDGSILQIAGYDRRSGLYLAPRGTFPPIPDEPTLLDAQAARDKLLEVVADFPFQKPAHKSAWLAAALTPLARHAFNGPSPLFAIDANIRGSGKSMLADSIGHIACGRNLARTSAPADDEEARKKITSIALIAEPLVLIDNVAGMLGCPALDAALTGTTWSDRILGKSQMTGELPLTTIWFATGNNLIFAADTSRRALHIRLNSSLERPEDRSDFRHPKLMDWVDEQRHNLAVAGLTLLRAYHVAGRPAMAIKPWGSFEAWSELVRQAVVWCGADDPGSTRQELAQESDRDARLLRLLIDAWEAADPQHLGMTVVKAIELASQDGNSVLKAAIAELTPLGKDPSARSIGMKLHHLQGRVCGGKRFHRDDARNGAIWRILDISESATEADSCGTSGTSATISNPSVCDQETSHTYLYAHIATGENSPASGASPALPAERPNCNHLRPETWVQRDGSAYCAACDKFMGRTSPHDHNPSSSVLLCASPSADKSHARGTGESHDNLG